jgi:hypothetical protein
MTNALAIVIEGEMLDSLIQELLLALLGGVQGLRILRPLLASYFLPNGRNEEQGRSRHWQPRQGEQKGLFYSQRSRL